MQDIRRPRTPTESVLQEAPPPTVAPDAKLRLGPATAQAPPPPSLTSLSVAPHMATRNARTSSAVQSTGKICPFLPRPPAIGMHPADWDRFCGSTLDYCGTGCQTLFGECSSVVGTAKCGNTFGGARCPAGQCCNPEVGIFQHTRTQLGLSRW